MIHLAAAHAAGPAVAGLGAFWPQVRTIPIGLRIALELAALIILVGRVVPWIAVPASTVVVGALAALRGTLLLGEYAVTSAMRRLRKSPPAAVYAFDDGLDLAVQGAQVVVRWTGRALSKRWSLRWLLLALAPVLLLLAQPALAASSGTRSYAGVTDGVLSLWYPVDGWVVSGHWGVVAASAPAASCTVRPR